MRNKIVASLILSTLALIGIIAVYKGQAGIGDILDARK